MTNLGNLFDWSYNMKGIKSMEHMELLLVLCWCQISLIQGNLGMAYYSKTAMPPYLRDGGSPKNSAQYLILDSSETILFSVISFFNLFAKDAKQGEDNADFTRVSCETLKVKPLNTNFIKYNNVTSGEAGISYSI